MELFKQKLAEIQRSYAENLEKASILAEKPRELADISVTLLIPKRKARIDSFFIAPAAKTSDLSDFLLQYFAKINDPFTVFCEKTCFFLVIPAKFEKQLAQFFTNPEILWEKAQEIAEIQRFCLEKEVFLQKVVRNREIVAVFGDFRNKSDLPQECVSYNFTEKRLVDYYSCENCGIKCILLIFS